MVSSVRAGGFAVAIGPRGVWEHARLIRSTGRTLAAREQKFALKLKQTGFDRTGATQSPQQACQPMSECKLDDGSRIDAADEGTLERSVRANMFESLDDGLVSKPLTPCAAA
jgi:hypothetical protein